jgi:multimeric flavodoxin WrbA
MPKVNSLLEKADIILFGTPIYWYGPTAQIKLLIDRLRPFIVSKKLTGKKGYLIVPSEEGPKICEPLIKMFQMSFEYVGMQYGGAFLTTAYEKGEIKNNLAEMQRALEFGQKI